LYDFGSWGIKFRINVVFPLPRNPVMMVTGMGAMMEGPRERASSSPWRERAQGERTITIFGRLETTPDPFPT
jgi:hypothetical protein